MIGLSASAEPEIYATTHRFGTILENVIYNPLTRLIDLDDDTRTENTRASYPLDFIDNAVPSKMSGHPQNIIFLTFNGILIYFSVGLTIEISGGFKPSAAGIA